MDIWKVFYKNGKIKREQTYVEGVSNGCCRNYYKNGNIQDEFFKKNGKLEGTVKCFYENGILKVESQYKNDYIEGYTKKYYKTGELKTDGYFRHGKENGVVKEYYRNGAIKIETIYVDGKIGETNKNYYENGKIKSISTYKEGIVQNCMNYDRKENLKSIEHYAKGTLTKTEYFKDGKLVSSEENKSLININLNKFYELIDLMKSTRVYTEEELKELWELDKIREQKIIEKAFNENITYGQASDEYNFLNQSYEDFQVYLKSINDNFSVNVEIIRYGFENYIKRGDAPFPYYAWRIAVILSKNRLYVEEKEFLHEWCRHFQRLENCGARYRDLVARARKKRAI